MTERNGPDSLLGIQALLFYLPHSHSLLSKSLAQTRTLSRSLALSPALSVLKGEEEEMLLGKRPRPPIKRTTSMTKFTFDLNDVEVPVPSDPQNHIGDRPKPAGLEGISRRIPGATSADGFDHHRLLSSVLISPRNLRRNSGDFVETAHFLRACGLCKRRLAPGRDIYMYKGETAFCSLECRQQQINQDERKEKCSLASKKEGASSSTATSDAGETVAAA